MNAIGIIFSNIHDYVIPELTRRRAIRFHPLLRQIPHDRL